MAAGLLAHMLATGGIVTESVAWAQTVGITVDGAPVALPQPAAVRGGYLVAPVRPVLEALGCTVGWDGAAGVVTVRRGERALDLKAGMPHARTDTGPLNLPVAPRMMGGTLVGPVRTLAEALGATVTWDARTQTVRITTAAAGGTASEITEQRAVTIATDYLKGIGEYPQQVTDVKAELGQAPANRYWQALRSGGPMVSDAPLRPAWTVTFTYTGLHEGAWKQVYVDAQTGEVIGGQQTR